MPTSPAFSPRHSLDVRVHQPLELFPSVSQEVLDLLYLARRVQGASPVELRAYTGHDRGTRVLWSHARRAEKRTVQRECLPRQAAQARRLRHPEC